MLQLLTAIEKATGCVLYPISSTDKGEQIIYNVTPIADDGIKKTYRFELNIVSTTLARVEEIDAEIRQALLGKGDSKPNNVLNIEVNGGGTLTSEVGIHRLLYFIVTEE